MYTDFIDEPMIQAFIHEATHILESLERIMIECESEESFSESSINQIFRKMHSIKGTSALMLYENISVLAHHLEDMFNIIREDGEIKYDFTALVDLVLESVDFFKVELVKVSNKTTLDGDPAELVQKIKGMIEKMKGGFYETPPDETSQFYASKSVEKDKFYYKANIKFEAGCEMENVRSYTVVQNAMELSDLVYFYPNDIIDNEKSIETVKTSGLDIIIKTALEDSEMKAFFDEVIFLESLSLELIDKDMFNHLAISYQDESGDEIKLPKASKEFKEKQEIASDQKMISVHVDKLDGLMNMVGELVIAESMVTQNPQIQSLHIDSFDKAARQLRKIASDLQDMVMGIRMVPLSTTFVKMHRIVRDMSKKLSKNVVLDISGETTEVDKGIIEKISDPLVHIIRNAIDHGIELPDERLQLGKSKQGVVRLEAKNSGSDVLIIVEDDGRGLNKEDIYRRAFKRGLITADFEEIADEEIYRQILHPGFSTKEEVTEYSGRGVGMDVVSKNLEDIGGRVEVDSQLGKKTTITLRIPLTLAIIEGMNLKVGDSRFTLPLMTIKESFRPADQAVFRDPSGKEMIMLRGTCYPILRLHKFYSIETDVVNCHEGILIMIEENEKTVCLFADELLGQQQVVVKTLPNYIRQQKVIKGVSGCTLLGDGNISLILDVKTLNNHGMGVRQ